MLHYSHRFDFRRKKARSNVAHPCVRTEPEFSDHTHTYCVMTYCNLYHILTFTQYFFFPFCYRHDHHRHQHPFLLLLWFSHFIFFFLILNVFVSVSIFMTYHLSRITLLNQKANKHTLNCRCFVIMSQFINLSQFCFQFFFIESTYNSTQHFNILYHPSNRKHPKCSYLKWNGEKMRRELKWHPKRVALIACKSIKLLLLVWYFVNISIHWSSYVSE